MNVLVYSGPEVLASHCITSLRTLLVPYYAVQSISQQSLVSHPWTANCALLVFPSCGSPHVNASFGPLVERFVEDGGKLLTIGATVRCQQTGGIQDGMARMTLTDRSASLQFSNKASRSRVNVVLGGGSIEQAQPSAVSMDDIQVNTLLRGSIEGSSRVAKPVAHCLKPGNELADVAVAHFDCGKGRAVFCTPLIDYPLTEEPLLSRLTDVLSSEGLQQVEAKRRLFLRKVLQHLDLDLPDQVSSSISPLPQFLTGPPSKPWIVDDVLKALSIDPESLIKEHYILRDSNDTFHFHLVKDDDWELLERARKESSQRTDPTSWDPKYVLVCRNGLLPSVTQAPLFDVPKFHDALIEARRRGYHEQEGSFGMGEAFLYSEVVTSTQTMLDKNPRVLSSLPAPFVSLASHQLAGRGRGSNIWLSPSGCLQFSVLLRVSLSEIPASRLVFVQYLFGLAVVEACRDETVLGEEGKRVKLKWPNDVYAVRVDGEKRKMGGILVNTSFLSGKAEIIIGCGLNVFNPPPIQSLLQLLPPESNIRLSMERTAAAILAVFESTWHTFLSNKGCFEPFLDLYYDRWLHSDQLVELTTVTPPQMVRIVGITSDHGLLRTMPERDGWSGASGGSYIDLQPDGNSFDLMAGLIKTKT